MHNQNKHFEKQPETGSQGEMWIATWVTVDHMDQMRSECFV